LNFLLGWRRLGLILDVSTFFNVPFSCLPIEGSLAMWALNGIAGLLLCRYPVGQLSYLLLYLWVRFARWVTFELINLFAKPYRCDELLSIFSPI
jgi:hypothetical protein|tara:strand:- start:597 stop:878 length:282 start_codon:yes stop_codon:yes gene_type:complete